MLPRLFLVTVLLVVSVLGQEEDQAGADVSSSEPLSVAERPRGERPQGVKGQDPEAAPASDLSFQASSAPSPRRPQLTAVQGNVSTPSPLSCAMRSSRRSPVRPPT